MATTNKEREMRVAVDRIVGFAKQFDEAHLNLACHAAFPLVLTPDLLYQIWAHFAPEAPWTAVARVLLSRLCRQVGYEMYEMDIAVRNLLLKELKEQFGQKRFDELAEFLMDYVTQRLTGDDSDTQDLREAQEWTALAYTKPDEVAREFTEALNASVKQEDIGKMFRLASLVETLAEPLVEAGFEPLLIYSRGIESFVRGDFTGAAPEFSKASGYENQVKVASVSLPIPNYRETLKHLDLKVRDKARKNVNQPPPTRTNLSQWFQNVFQVDWQAFEELLEPGEANLIFPDKISNQFRKPISDQTAAIPALINLLHSDSDEETHLKAVEHLGGIVPGNSKVITALIELLNTSQDRWTKVLAAESLGRISTGNSEAIAALTTLLQTSQDDELCCQAALNLGKIDPGNPKAAVGRGRQIELGMQADSHSIVLLVVLMPEAGEEVSILLHVRPNGSATYLPPNLQLIVLDESGAVFSEVKARSADNWIQQKFTCEPGERFSVRLTLGDESFTEDFMI